MWGFNNLLDFKESKFISLQKKVRLNDSISLNNEKLGRVSSKNEQINLYKNNEVIHILGGFLSKKLTTSFKDKINNCMFNKKFN